MSEIQEPDGGQAQAVAYLVVRDGGDLIRAYLDLASAEVTARMHHALVVGMPVVADYRQSLAGSGE